MKKMAGADFKQIEAELREFGEVVDKKKFSKNPEVYIKKLNHLRVRSKQASPGRSGSRANQSRVEENGGSQESDNDENGLDDDDDDEEDSRRRTRRGVVVQKTVTEKTNRRRTVHELPSSSRLSPSRRAGVPIPAGPIINRNEDNDGPATRRRSGIGGGIPIVSDADLDLNETRSSRSSSRWTSTGLGVPVAAGPIPGRSSESKKPENVPSSSSKPQSTPDRGSWFSFSGRKAADKPSPKVSSQNTPTRATNSRRLLSDFSDDEGEYSVREAANASVNTSSRWPDTSSIDLSSIRSKIGLNSSRPADTTSSNFSAGNFLSRSADRAAAPRDSIYSQPVTRTYQKSNDWSSNSVGGRYSTQWSTQSGTKKGWFDRQNLNVCSFMVKYLTIVPILMFVVFAAIYINIKLNPSIDSSTSNFLECVEGSPKGGCLTRAEVDTVKPVLQKLLEVLSKQAGDYDCESTTGKRSLTIAEAQHRLKNADLEYSDTKKLFEIIQLNPDWKIKLLGDDGKTETADLTKVANLESEGTTMTLLCRLRIAIHRTFYRIFVAVLVIAGVVLIATVVRRYKKYQEAQQKELHVLIDSIVGMLKNHANAVKDNRGGSDIPSYIPVPNVRDALIPLKDRKKKQSQWNKAMKFLSESESRIREEVNLIDGEETLCWKWVEPFSDKFFAGREQTRSDVTGLSTRPMSSCLKIINLYRDDVDDIELRDAVLDRCGTYHGILHYAAGPDLEGFVYIKCVSDKAAGQNYKHLHGWWHDSRLVSVQYVSDVVYRNLFPDSLNAMLPLKSSSKQKKLNTTSNF